MIVDAQSVKNTDTAKQKGYDAGKKVSGIKRHIAVDTNGLPHAICVTTADVTDRKGALEAFTLHKKSLKDFEQALKADRKITFCVVKALVWGVLLSFNIWICNLNHVMPLFH